MTKLNRKLSAQERRDVLLAVYKNMARDVMRAALASHERRFSESYLCYPWGKSCMKVALAEVGNEAAIPLKTKVLWSIAGRVIADWMETPEYRAEQWRRERPRTFGPRYYDGPPELRGGPETYNEINNGGERWQALSELRAERAANKTIDPLVQARANRRKWEVEHARFLAGIRSAKGAHNVHITEVGLFSGKEHARSETKAETEWRGSRARTRTTSNHYWHLIAGVRVRVVGRFVYLSDRVRVRAGKGTSLVTETLTPGGKWRKS